MIKNLNDIVSLITLLLLIIFSLRVFVWAFISKEKEELEKVNKWKLIEEYYDNIEE